MEKIDKFNVNKEPKKKLINAAYAATSGAAVGSTAGVLASATATRLAVGSGVGSVIPFVGTMIGGVAGLAIETWFLAINKKQENSSEENTKEV